MHIVTDRQTDGRTDDSTVACQQPNVLRAISLANKITAIHIRLNVNVGVVF